ncbi:MAG: hypothetical protein Fues2KO_04410 [Fuerstiella sp.]
MDDDVEDQQPEAAELKKGERPVVTFRGSGGLSVAVWRQPAEDSQDRYTVTFERSYWHNGSFQTANNLREGDVLRLQKLLDQADDWIEQAKNRQRGSGGVQR